MGGVDTYRGIAYQHAQAVLSALDVLESDDFVAIRVEGVDDAIDIELLDANGRIAVGKQAKVRADEYTWSKADLVGLLHRWASVDAPDDASFQFITDGRLGPSGEQVRDALADAAAGRMEPLAKFLGEVDEAIVRRAARATIVQDPGGTGALLARADRQMMALLPSARSAADALEQAKSAVDALFRLLLDRACRRDAAERVVSRDDIWWALGIPPSLTAVRPWAGDVRDRYLVAVAAEAPAAAIPARLTPEDPSNPPAVGVDALLTDGATPAAVAGPTGAGKSTAARELRSVAATQGRVVVVAHAETYIPGRVDALVADAVSDVLGQEVPTLTGRHVLADTGTTVVIDGVSEVPGPVRAALAEDLRGLVSAGRGARLVLLGRGLAAVRSVLPGSSAPSLFRMEPFGRERRETLAESVVGARGGDSARVVLARTEEALGDAAENPMLLEMTLDLIASGIPFDDRAAVYGAFIERLANKTGADGLGVATVVLGACFARLLDEGRRYADPYTWRRLLVEVATAQSAVIGSVEAATVDESARRSGLIVRLGQSETVAAVHDSFADYLAGLALARGAVTFPAHVAPGDEERLLFAAQIGGIDRTFAQSVASRLPFALPRLAVFDRRGLGDGAPDEVSALLGAVVPPGAPAGADLWRHPDGRVVAFARADAGGWLADDDAQAALSSRPWTVGGGGPVDLAVRLWRQWLLSVLRSTGGAGLPRPKTAEEACDAVASHTADVAAETDRLLRAAVPSGYRPAVAAEIGPTGLTGHLLTTQNSPRGGADWTVAYTRTDGIDVGVADRPLADEANLSHGTLDSLIGESASAQAAKRVIKAIDSMAGGRWL